MAIKEIARRVSPEPVPQKRLLTVTELCDRLRVSRTKIERDVRDGLPCVDVGQHHPKRRRKRSLRFDWDRVIQWYESHAGQPGRKEE